MAAPVGADTDHPNGEHSMDFSSNQARVNEILTQAVRQKETEAHLSAMYPPMWMPATWASKLRFVKAFVFSTIACIALVSALVVDSLVSSNAWLQMVLVLAAVMSLASGVCYLFHLEELLDLTFCGTILIHTGGLLGIVAQASGDLRLELASSIVIAIGVVIFAATALVHAPWQYMVGSIFLSISMLFRVAAATMSLVGGPREHELMIVAAPFALVAFPTVGTKSFMQMRRPWLSFPNYMFYGVCLFGCGVMIQSGLSAHAYITQNPSLGDIQVLPRLLVFAGTIFFMLRSARVAFHVDTNIEDRYPLTAHLLDSHSGFLLAWIGCALLVVIGIAGAAGSAVVGTQVWPATASAAIGFGKAVGFAVLAASFCIPRSSGVGTSTSVTSLQVIGCLGLSVGPAVTACGYIAALRSLLLTGEIIAFIGAVVLAVLAVWRASESACVTWKPTSWLYLLHPGNYVLLAASYFALAAVLRITYILLHDDFSTLLSVSNNTLFCGALVLCLHLSMAQDVWETTHLNFQESSGPYAVEEETVHADILCDVVIVGGGPTGLLLACILGKAGVKVLLVEQRAEVVTDARFAVINSASMEIFLDTLDEDLLRDLRARAMPESCPYGSMLLSGLGHKDARVWNAANTPPRSQLMKDLQSLDDWTGSRTLGSRHARELPLRVMQSHQEAVLRKQAERLSCVEVRYGWKAMHFHEFLQSGRSRVNVQVCAAPADGAEAVAPAPPTSVTAKFIVGADGPASIVAKRLQFRFDGLINVAKTRSILVKAPGLYERVVNTVGATHQYQIIRKNWGLTGVVAADPARDIWNFLMLFGQRTKSAPADELAKEFLGTDDLEVLQDRAWYWNFFIAREFKKGNAFLIGDAAHSWPPFGGLGRNTGYGDAHNLGWKMIAACKSEDNTKLLDSYDQERRQMVLKTAMYVLRATPRPELLKALISPFFDQPLLRMWIASGWYFHNSGTHGHNHFCQAGIQFGIALTCSPVVCSELVPPADDPNCMYHQKIMAGCRIPDCSLVDDSRVSDHIAHGHLSVLVIPDLSGKHTPDTIALAKNLEVALQRRHFPVKVVLLPSTRPTAKNEAVREHYSRNALVLVRPDFYVAWRLPTSHAAASVDLERVVNVVTGRSNELRSELASYQQWLTRLFMFNLRPFGFTFPWAIPVQNTTKEEAVSKVKRKGGESGESFQTTTKQEGDERTQEASGVRVSARRPSALSETRWTEGSQVGSLVEGQFSDSEISPTRRISQTSSLSRVPTRRISQTSILSKVPSFRDPTLASDLDLRDTEDQVDDASDHAESEEVTPLELELPSDAVLPASPIARLLLLAELRKAKGLPVLNFAVGNPALPPPSEVLTTIRQIVDDEASGAQQGSFKYTHPAGVFKLREQLAVMLSAWQRVPVPAESIVVTPGAQSALVNVLRAVLSPGDVALVLRPYYPDYLDMVELWGGQCRFVDVDPETSELDLDSLKATVAEIGHKLRCMIVCSPGNPTGMIVSEDTLRKIANVLAPWSGVTKPVWLICDNTYWRMSFREEVAPCFPTFASSIIVSSFSKDLSLAGERLGFVAVHPDAPCRDELVGHIIANNGRLGNISPPSLVQHTISRLLAENALPNLTPVYHDRVKALHAGLLRAGMRSCRMPDGAFYLFPKLPDGINSEAFCAACSKKGLFAIPGTGFGREGYVRFAALPALDEIGEACAIVEGVLASLKDVVLEI